MSNYKYCPSCQVLVDLDELLPGDVGNNQPSVVCSSCNLCINTDEFLFGDELPDDVHDRTWGWFQIDG